MISRATLSGPFGFVSVEPPKDSSHHVLSSSPGGTTTASSPSSFFSGGGLSIFGLQCSRFKRPRSLILISVAPSLLNSIPKGENVMTASNLLPGPYLTVLFDTSRSSLAFELNPRPPTIVQDSASLYLSFRALLSCLSVISPFCLFSSSTTTLATPDSRNEMVTGSLTVSPATFMVLRAIACNWAFFQVNDSGSNR